MDPVSWAAMTAAVSEAAAAMAIPATAAAEAGTAIGAGSMMAGLPLEAGIMAAEAGAGLGAGGMLGLETLAPLAATEGIFGAFSPTAIETAAALGEEATLADTLAQGALPYALDGGGMFKTMTGMNQLAPWAGGTGLPWKDMAMAGAKGALMAGMGGQPAPSGGGGGRPGGGGGAGVQQLPTFDFGAPTTQTASMADLMRQREEMMRRRMQRGY